MSVFGDHQLGIPYRPIAELFAMYRERDPEKTAIVDLDSGNGDYVRRARPGHH